MFLRLSKLFNKNFRGISLLKFSLILAFSFKRIFKALIAYLAGVTGAIIRSLESIDAVTEGPRAGGQSIKTRS